MHFCYFLFFFAFLLTPGFANDAVWNCHQDKNSKEWVCTGEKAPAADAGEKPLAHQPEPIAPARSEVKETEVKESAPAEVRETEVKESAPTEVRETEVKESAPTEVRETEVKESAPTEVRETEAKESAPAEIKETEVKESAPASAPVLKTETESKPPLKPVAEKEVPVRATARKAIAVKENLRQEDTRQAGWHCKAAEGGQDWNCNLTGPDPKGKARVVASQEKGFSLIEPAFDAKEEQIFANLASNLKYDPWAKCSIEPGAAPAFTPGKGLRDISPLDINADFGEVFDNEISSYKGNVEILRADQHSFSKTAQYDSVSQSLDLQGEVYYSEDNLSIYSNSANLKLAQDQATLRNVQFINPTTPLRGRAGAAYRESKTLSRYKDVAYTTCPPGNTDWVLHASDLKLNDATGKGAVKNAWLEFKGTPVFYSPYLSFPVDSRRLSGFLAPSFGNTQRSGFDLSVPYYWNIAPNYDATFRPRYLTKRGPMLVSDFRLLTKYSNGRVGFEYMPNDELRNQSRFLGTIKNSSHFGSHLTSNLDLNYVSDKEFFNELGNALSFPNFSHIRSTADLGYTDKNRGISLIGRIENYQTIDKTLTGFKRPYRRLPQINLDLNHAFDFMPLNAALDGEYVNFEHSDLVSGQRFNIKPSVSAPLQTEWGFLRPKLSVQHTDYQLSNQDAGKPSSITRTLPIFSMDSGMTFERELGRADSALKHTIEPRLFYLYVPRKDQKDIPLFDSSLYDLWFNNLFRENRFSGTDRVQDANQITAALTTRLLDSAGREKLKFRIGEILYFKDREVTAPVRIRNLPDLVTNRPDFPKAGLESPAETDSVSPLIAELSSEFTDHWSGETGIQWNPQSNQIVRGKAVLHFVNEAEKILNLGFHYRRDDLIKRTLLNNPAFLSTTDPATGQVYNPLNDPTVLQGNDLIQSDFSFRWPLLDNWYAIGRWQYSWLYNNTQDSFFGFEKENCCWRFRLIGRRYINGFNTTVNTASNTQLAEGTSQNGVFFQIELKGLTGLGENLDQFFEQSIFGYQRPTK